MAVNYLIRAQVIDIKHDNPKQDDAFFVDTNVWYWFTYTRTSLGDHPPKNYQVGDYPSYIKKALTTRSKLYSCGLSLAEFSALN